jgi:hypothetical protein
MKYEYNGEGIKFKIIFPFLGLDYSLVTEDKTREFA